jgi:hypothetical protein
VKEATPAGRRAEEDRMISAETMKWRLQEGLLTDFDLVFWHGRGRVVATDDTTLSLLVRGKRTDYTWDRVSDTWQRFQENHTLTVDELGGQADAVGLVSLFAAFGEERVEVLSGVGQLRLHKTKGQPVRPDPGYVGPESWSVYERKIGGN